jgi:hypothetical protein
MSLTSVAKFFMGTYPCFWAFRFGSLQVRNVAVYVSFEAIWTSFLVLPIFDVFGFLAPPVLRVFLDPFWDDLRVLAHSLASMHF